MDKKIEKKPWVKKNIRYVIMGIMIMGAGGYLLSFTDHSSKLNVEIDKISLGDVEYGVFRDYIAVVGTVKPIKTIYLDATVGGSVDEIYVDEGTEVKKGEPILRLENDKLVLELSNNEAQVERAINDLMSMRLNLRNQNIGNNNKLNSLHYNILKLKREYDRNQRLFKNKYISKEELDLAREKYKQNIKEYELLKDKAIIDSIFMSNRVISSNKSIQRMNENLKLTRKRLEKLLVIAPEDGELATLSPEIGEVINYGRRLGTMNILDSYKISVEIDEHYISRVKRELKGECNFSNKIYPAMITKIYPKVNKGRFKMDMEFMNEVPTDIRIGQTSHIRLELGESNETILIPRGGFYQSTGGQWIFVLDKSGDFAIKRMIQIGRQNPQYYEVLKGLKPGEEVIISGYDSYGDVDKLMLK